MTMKNYVISVKTPYLDVLHEIQNQLTRLSNKNNKLAREKFNRAEQALRDVITLIEGNRELAESEKVRHLIHTMLPIFKENTGWNLSTPTSYTSLTGLARNMGIFKKDIQPEPKYNEDQLHYVRLGK